MELALSNEADGLIKLEIRYSGMAAAKRRDAIHHHSLRTHSASINEWDKEECNSEMRDQVVGAEQWVASLFKANKQG